MRKLIAVFAIALFASSYAFGQSTAATGTIRANIESRALTLTSTQDLNFGSILPFSSSGSVTVHTINNTPTITNVHIVDTTDITSSSWTVSGIESAPYVISLPTEATLSNGSDAMSVTNFSHNAGSSPTLNSTNGTAIFRVGATLNLAGNQPGGAYSGTFDVTVNYP